MKILSMTATFGKLDGETLELKPESLAPLPGVNDAVDFIVPPNIELFTTTVVPAVWSPDSFPI